jgi:hypothetical protein
MNKKELLEALKQLKESYLKDTSLGLCHAFWSNNTMDDFTNEQGVGLEKYIKENTGVHELHSPYAWKRGDKESRLKWIETHIELNK